ncbi:MAG: hypothetical protein M1833_003312 [Piccolia ochrophora]|nr:MAG: hypothetical protein M1833_003312 [Piccolia ochrophora]
MLRSLLLGFSALILTFITSTGAAALYQAPRNVDLPTEPNPSEHDVPDTHTTIQARGTMTDIAEVDERPVSYPENKWNTASFDIDGGLFTSSRVKLTYTLISLERAERNVEITQTFLDTYKTWILDFLSRRPTPPGSKHPPGTIMDAVAYGRAVPGSPREKSYLTIRPATKYRKNLDPAEVLHADTVTRIIDWVQAELAKGQYFVRWKAIVERPKFDLSRVYLPRERGTVSYWIDVPQAERWLGNECVGGRCNCYDCNHPPPEP